MVIMPLGSSTTEGQSNTLNYRVRLSDRLTAAGITASFVGSMTTNSGNLPVGRKNHEGHSGWCTSDAGGICQPGDASYNPERPIGVVEHIDTWIANTPADAILLLIGGNDVNQNNVDENIVTICNKILAARPAALVYVSAIRSRDNSFNSTNIAIQAAVAGMPRVKYLNAYAGIISPDDFADDLHLNSTGYTKMGDNWFAAIQASNMATIDPTTPIGVQPNGFAGGYTLSMSDEFNSSTLNPMWRPFRDFGDFQAPFTYDVNANNNSLLRMWWTGNSGNDNMEFSTTGNPSFRQRFGFFEAKVKCIRGRGFFPAFWLYPQSDSGTENSDGQQQEIDIVEWFAYENGDWLVDTVNFRCKNASFTVWQEGGGGSTTNTGQRFLGGHVDPVTGQVGSYDNTVSTASHTYGMRWTAADGLQFYYDGIARGSAIRDPWGAGNNMQLAVFLQLWWGPLGGNPTPDGNTPAGSSNAMEWDYVRCWTIGGPSVTFNCHSTDAPNDGATIAGIVHFGIAGDLLANAELLPSTGYVPTYGRFTLTQGGTAGDLYWDTTQLANGSITVRISAFNTPPGGNGTEIVVFTRTYIISNIAPPVSVSVSATTSAVVQLANTFCMMDVDGGKFRIS